MGFLWDHWRDNRAKRIAERSIAAFNDRDFDSLRTLLAPDYVLIDSMGETLAGRERVFMLLNRLFAWDPQFHIQVENMTTHKDTVLITGSTTGSHRLSSQRTLYRMVLRDGHIAEWRSYSADNPRPVTRMLMGSQAQVRVEVPAQEAA